MSTHPLTVLLAGTPGTTVIIGEALVAAGHSIVGVLCPFPKPAGRKKIITPSELERWARKKNIQVFHVNKEVLAQDTFRASLPIVDLLVVADFGYLIPSWLLKHPKLGGLNIHPSLLPRWRGASPVPFTLLFGDKTTGVTVIKMNEEFDKGEIVAQSAIEVAPEDTTPTLLNKGFRAGAQLLVKNLDSYADGTISLKQQESSPTPLTRRFTKDDGFVPFSTLQAVMANQEPAEAVLLLESYDLKTSAENITNMVRALTPWPGVWTIRSDGKRVKILQATLENEMLKLLATQVEGQKPESFKAL